MAQWLTVWRAAHLLGVPRGTLQRRVQAGDLPISEGLVSTEALLQLYPQAELQDGGLLERVSRLKEEAFGRRVRERLLPSQEVLAQRLFRQSEELAEVRRHLQRYHALVIRLDERLGELVARSREPSLVRLRGELAEGLARALADGPADALDVMDDALKIVSAQVTLRPSGHEFAVEGRDTLLQAGLRAGLRLNYGCGNGSCGMCKARVIAGEVARVMAADYPLSEVERAQGYTLLCAHTAASAELTIEALEAAGPQDIPEQQLVARVRGLRELAPGTRLLHLQTPRTRRLRFLAGPSVTLGLARGESGVHAGLPLASCPCDDRNLHFFVARDAGDPFAAAVFDDSLRVGDQLTVWGPYGDFVLADGQRPLVFAACDLSFAPVKSLIEHALSLEASPSLSLFWLATRADGHFMVNQCRAWSEALDPFEYALFTDADVVHGAQQVLQAMRADLFDIECDFYVAGPDPFVAALESGLRAAGVPQAQIRMWAFG